MNDSHLQILQPQNWTAPQGYANGVTAEGRHVFIAGQIAWDEQARLVSGDFVIQVEQTLSNVIRILAEAGGLPHHVTRLTWYLTDKAAYIARRKEVGEVYRRVLGRHFPAMTLVVVAGLLEDGALVEIEATAVIPAKRN